MPHPKPPPKKRKPTPLEVQRRRQGADYELMTRRERAEYLKGQFKGPKKESALKRGSKDEKPKPAPSGLKGKKSKSKLRRQVFTHEGPPVEGPTRIQKLISIAGIASRREAEEMIEQGRVMVNGQRATIGQKVDPFKDKVIVDGSRLRLSKERVTYVLNKPRGVVSTRSDERGRMTVLDLIKGGDRYLYPVGRLDYDSEGLMLLTNDGELANGLTHPRHQVPKTYRALIERVLDDDQISRLKKGIHLEDGVTRPAELALFKKVNEGVWYEIVIKEGRNRQVRRMFSAVGAGVRRLVRVAIGPLKLAELPTGTYRPITPEELALLKEAYADHPVPTR